MALRLRRTLLLALASLLPCLAGAAAPLAPDFTLRTLSGPNLRLHEQRGRVVLLNFWATWCAPCRDELPHLNRLQAKYQAAGFTVWGVSVDDDPAKVAATARQLGLAFPVLLDSDKNASRLYQLKAMPSTVLIDRDGRVRHLHRGYQRGFEDTYDQQIRELLKE